MLTISLRQHARAQPVMNFAHVVQNLLHVLKTIFNEEWNELIAEVVTKDTCYFFQTKSSNNTIEVHIS